jgi:alpha,alpha-trehalase
VFLLVQYASSLSYKRKIDDKTYLLAIKRASSVYTTGSILNAVEMLSIFNDSKSFVDMPMKRDPEDILMAWNQLPVVARQDVQLVSKFVAEYFYEAGSDLEPATLSDISASLPWVTEISNASYQVWANSLNSLWKDLGRQVISDVSVNPQRYSIIKQKHPFIIPGGRFRENYYWDSYWIILGLLASDAWKTATNIIENFLDDINLFGFIPNGGRIYYLDRSQPPVLSEMIVSLLLYSMQSGQAADVNDDFLDRAIDGLEKEYSYWMSTIDEKQGGHGVKLDTSIILNRYYVDTSSPRPESYREDTISCSSARLITNQTFCYSNIAAAAESGWDFSSRWFASQDEDNESDYSMSSLATKSIIPVDLNSILLRMEQNIAILYEYRDNPALIASIFSQTSSNHSFEQRRAMVHAMNSFKSSSAQAYVSRSYIRAKAIQAYLWTPEQAKWRDYWMSATDRVSPRDDVLNASKISEYYPIWADVDFYDASIDLDEVFESFRSSDLLQSYGMQTTTLSQNVTGQQWDSPNAWSPLQLISVEMLLSLNLPAAKEAASTLLASWLESNFAGWTKSAMMYEKYNSMICGERGIGGEYPPQAGFGWTNGVVLHMLSEYSIN